ETLMQERHLQQSAYLNALAQRSGCRDFNEMWDHLFEVNFQTRSTESFMREVATYCFFARYDAAPETLEADGTAAREHAMALAIKEALTARNEMDGPILVVTGGLHTIALPQLANSALKRSSSTSISPDSVQQ